MKIEAKYLSIYELGQRSNQEDSIYPAIGEMIAHNDLFILCDGMGGHDQGEVASQTVCDALSEYMMAHSNADFESALNYAYDALDAKDTGSEKKMGTTLTLVKFEDDGCIVAHIGDSRVYQIRPSEKRVVFVTKDHSLVNDLIACGELTPEEAKHSPQKNVITRAMQPHQERRTKADISILTDIKAGDYFYMCSDGMLEISEDQDIVNVLAMDKTDEQKVEILKRVTENNKDNHSAHLIHITAVNGAKKEADVVPIRGRMRFWLVLSLAIILFATLAILFMPRKEHSMEDENQIEMQEDTTTTVFWL
jgi:protein phosphatase